MVITGAAGRVGTRVIDAVLGGSCPSFDEVVAVDIRAEPVEITSGGRQVRWLRADLATEPLAPLLAGADALVHLACGDGDDETALAANAALTARLLAASGGIDRLVVISSAAVYGARFDNPLPLTEQAELRPTTRFPYAAHKARIEELAREWHDSHPGAAVAVLRPAPVYGPPGVVSWIAEATLPPLGDRIGQSLPALQFLHIDDLVAAIVHVLEHRLDGVFNVAPDGWIPGDEAPALLGAALGTMPLPEVASDAVTGAVRWVRGTREASGAKPYMRAPWVVANDRLRSTGWMPRSSSAEALVAHFPPTWWSQLVARRRQEVTLGAVSGLVLTVGGIISARIARRLRR